MSDMNKSQNLPFATDEECAELRKRLVRAGKIIPDKGLPGPLAHSSEPDCVPISRGRRNAHDIPEEGTYKCRKITSDEEHERRKRNYFVVLQEILRSREPEDFDDRDFRREQPEN